MFNKNGSSHLYIFLLIGAIVFLSGCIKVRENQSTPTLLKTEEATQGQLVAEVDRYARVGSMRAKIRRVSPTGVSPPVSGGMTQEKKSFRGKRFA